MPVTNYDFLIDKQLQWGEAATLDSARIWAVENPNDYIVPMGFGVVKGSGERGIELPSASTDLFEGIAYFSDTFEKRSGYTLTSQGWYGYPKKYTMSIFRKGVIAVPVDQAMARGDEVHMYYETSATNTLALPGTFRKAAVTDKTFQLTYARVYKGCEAPAANQLETCWIDLRMPN